MGTNTDTKLIEISPYMHQIGHSLNSREITRNVQEGTINHVSQFGHKLTHFTSLKISKAAKSRINCLTFNATEKQVP